MCGNWVQVVSLFAQLHSIERSSRSFFMGFKYYGRNAIKELKQFSNFVLLAAQDY